MKPRNTPLQILVLLTLALAAESASIAKLKEFPPTYVTPGDKVSYRLQDYFELAENEAYTFKITFESAKITPRNTSSDIPLDASLTGCSSPQIKFSVTQKLMISFCANNTKLMLVQLALNGKNPVVIGNYFESLPVDTADAGVSTKCYDADFGIGDTNSLYISCMDIQKAVAPATVDTVKSVRLIRYDMGTKKFDTSVVEANTGSPFALDKNLSIKCLVNGTNYYLVVYQKENSKLMLFTIQNADKKTLVTPSSALIDISIPANNMSRIFIVDQWMNTAVGKNPQFFIFGYLNDGKNSIGVTKVTTVWDATTHAYKSNTLISAVPIKRPTNQFLAIGQPFLEAPLPFSFIAQRIDKTTITLGGYMSLSVIGDKHTDIKEFTIPELVEDDLSIADAGFAGKFFWMSIKNTKTQSMLGIKTIQLLTFAQNYFDFKVLDGYTPQTIFDQAIYFPESPITMTRGEQKFRYNRKTDANYLVVDTTGFTESQQISFDITDGGNNNVSEDITVNIGTDLSPMKDPNNLGISGVSVNFGMGYKAFSAMRYDVYPGFAQITTKTPDIDNPGYAITFDYSIGLYTRPSVDLSAISGNFLLEHKAGESKVSISACESLLNPSKTLHCTLWKEQA
jgi:hypothetical protein